MLTKKVLRPIYTIRFVVYDCQVGVCDLLYTRVNGVFQHLPWNYKQELFHVQTITYARVTIVYDKSYRVNGPLGIGVVGIGARVLIVIIHLLVIIYLTSWSSCSGYAVISRGTTDFKSFYYLYQK